MKAWQLLWKAEALLLAVVVGCSATPAVLRVEDAGQGRAIIHIPRTADVSPVTLEQEEFQQAVRRLAREVRLTGTPRQMAERQFQMDPQFGNYLWLEKDQKLVSCRSVVECREGLTRALKALAKEITTPGTELNQLVTRQQSR